MTFHDIEDLIAAYERGTWTRDEVIDAVLDHAAFMPMVRVLERTPEPWRSEVIARARAMYDNDAPVDQIVFIGGGGEEERRAAIPWIRAWLHAQHPPAGRTSWAFTIRLDEDAPVWRVLERSAAIAIRGLEGMARAVGLGVTTAEHGEDALVIDGPIDAAALRDAFTRVRWIGQLRIDFAQPDGSRGRLFFELNTDDIDVLLVFDTGVLPPDLARFLRVLTDEVYCEFAYADGYSRSR